MKRLLAVLLFSACAIAQTPSQLPNLANDWQIKPTAAPLGALPAPGAPTTSAPTAGGSCDAGTHLWAVTFLNAAGETTIGTAGTVRTCVSSTGQTEALTAIPTGPTGTVNRNVYRTKAGTSTPYFLDCASAPCIANNTTTTFSDTLADSALGAGPPSTNTTGPYTIASADAYLKTVTVSNSTGGTLTFTLADLQGSPVAAIKAASISANTTQVFSWPGYYWCPGGFTVQASGSGLTFYVGYRQ